MVAFQCTISPFLLQFDKTTLHVAAEHGHCETSNLQKGADVHALNKVSATFSGKARSM